MRRYHIQDRDDYKKYNKITGLVTKLTNILKQLEAKDSTRIELTDQLLEKCVNDTIVQSPILDFNTYPLHLALVLKDSPYLT